MNKNTKLLTTSLIIVSHQNLVWFKIKKNTKQILLLIVSGKMQIKKLSKINMKLAIICNYKT